MLAGEVSQLDVWGYFADFYAFIGNWPFVAFVARRAIFVVMNYSANSWGYFSTQVQQYKIALGSRGVHPNSRPYPLLLDHLEPALSGTGSSLLTIYLVLPASFLGQ